jgi:hypothetical protein
MTLWQRLYVTAAEPVVPVEVAPATNSIHTLHSQLLQELPTTLEALGFKTYDPFGLMPSTRVYPQTVKLFISPADDHARWLKFILAPDSVLPDDLLHRLSQYHRFILLASLKDESTAHFTVYRDGEAPAAWEETLKPYFVNGHGRTQALTDQAATPSAIPTDGMPDELRAMTDQLSGGLQNKQVQNMMNRMSSKLLSADQQQEGQNLLRSGQIDWTRPGGQQITQTMASLGISTWQIPEYTALRDAYQLQRRLQRNPHARLYPGDQEAMDAVPDALRYTPIFAGSAGT